MAMAITKIAKLEERLYHATCSSFNLGVKEYTSPLSSSSDLVRFVAKDKITVRIVLVEHAKIAVQKVCAISTG